MSNIDADWRDVVRAATIDTTTQETPVTDQENPTVSKLREAFDAAKNAIVEGTELAKQVEELRRNVSSLNSEVLLLQRDLEYIRSRNRELDEQVTEVRRQRDNASADAATQHQRADAAESDLHTARVENMRLTSELNTLYNRMREQERERDDALTMALEYEGKFKEAAAKLAKIGEAFGLDETKDVAGSITGRMDPKPVPHYEVQPRDEVGKFQPFEPENIHPAGSQGQF